MRLDDFRLEVTINESDDTERSNVTYGATWHNIFVSYVVFNNCIYYHVDDYGDMPINTYFYHPFYPGSDTDKVKQVFSHNALPTFKGTSVETTQAKVIAQKIQFARPLMDDKFCGFRWK
jgi:hypothetical protein